MKILSEIKAILSQPSAKNKLPFFLGLNAVVLQNFGGSIPRTLWLLAFCLITDLAAIVVFVLTQPRDASGHLILQEHEDSYYDEIVYAGLSIFHFTIPLICTMVITGLILSCGPDLNTHLWAKRTLFACLYIALPCVIFITIGIRRYYARGGVSTTAMQRIESAQRSKNLIDSIPIDIKLRFEQLAEDLGVHPTQLLKTSAAAYLEAITKPDELGLIYHCCTLSKPLIKRLTTTAETFGIPIDSIIERAIVHTINNLETIGEEDQRIKIPTADKHRPGKFSFIDPVLCQSLAKRYDTMYQATNHWSPLLENERCILERYSNAPSDYIPQSRRSLPASEETDVVVCKLPMETVKHLRNITNRKPIGGCAILECGVSLALNDLEA